MFCFYFVGLGVGPSRLNHRWIKASMFAICLTVLLVVVGMLLLLLLLLLLRLR